ncbi:hypothetical protein BDN72DRAFT_897549 [Pluteus cervinus]|uniref:Uncharacterized protein n=1 Tax=Pluteus cervinus TaxID=181527 RepID=A0ACD3AUX2_9AGAR|nr:hypothetical protein BDN72DRAFT_897549 [Pluteus cervinus]
MTTGPLHYNSLHNTFVTSVDFPLSKYQDTSIHSLSGCSSKGFDPQLLPAPISIVSPIVSFPTTKHLLPHSHIHTPSLLCIPCTSSFTPTSLPSQNILPMAILYGEMAYGWLVYDNKQIVWLPGHLRSSLLGYDFLCISQNPLKRHSFFDWTSFVHGDQWTSIWKGNPNTN